MNIELKRPPAQVPILDELDVIRNRFHWGGRSCLSGWSIKTFKNRSDMNVVDAMMREEVRIETGEEIYFMAEYNDDMGTQKTTIAKLWNRVMKKLGYVISCDRKLV